MAVFGYSVCRYIGALLLLCQTGYFQLFCVNKWRRRI